ncbi:50S ribosomal protein L11 methyltransferase [Thermodesulfobacteriota bacterium]
MIKGLVREKDEAGFGKCFLGNWVEDDTSYLFFSKPSRPIISDLVDHQPRLEFMDDFHFTYEQWQGESLGPIRVEDFLVIPPWDSVEDDRSALQIILDPGVVFGSGLHPTTSDCLKALICLHGQYPIERVLDLGTGTGILALAAAALGAERVLAVDLNPLSVKTTKRNIKLNQCEEIVSVFQGRAEDYVDEEADLVVANLHYAVIHDLLRNAAFHKKRFVIISGLMRSQFLELKSKLSEYHLAPMKVWDHEMTWYTLLARNLDLQIIN